MKKWKNSISVFIKGLFIGGSMLVPGVSGGTMAMLLGIYDDLIQSVNAVTRLKFKRLPFLLVFVAGALAGFLVIANPIDWLLLHYPKPTLYFFIGAVIGGIPIMFKESGVKNASIPNILSIIICIPLGMAIVLALRYIPVGLFDLDLTSGFSMSSFLILFVTGIVVAIALILPGISTSFMLLALGIYDQTIGAIKNLYLPFLIPLGLGLVAGVLLTTGILEKAMKSFPTQTYLLIIGFVFGSVLEIKPGIPQGTEWPICIVAVLVSMITLYKVSKIESN